MIESRASRTAMSVAVLRALHQEVDPPPVFVDPLAARYLAGRDDGLRPTPLGHLLRARNRSAIAAHP